MKDVSQWKLMWKKFRKISNLNKVWKILWIKWNNFEKHSKITRWFFIVFFFIGTTYLWYDRIIHTISKYMLSFEVIFFVWVWSSNINVKLKLDLRNRNSIDFNNFVVRWNNFISVGCHFVSNKGRKLNSLTQISKYFFSSIYFLLERILKTIPRLHVGFYFNYLSMIWPNYKHNF